MLSRIDSYLIVPYVAVFRLLFHSQRFEIFRVFFWHCRSILVMTSEGGAYNVIGWTLWREFKHTPDWLCVVIATRSESLAWKLYFDSLLSKIHQEITKLLSFLIFEVEE